MATLVRNFDWAATPLGPIEGWPQSLKTTTSLLLLSPVPIVMLWGERGYMIYNDAYSVFAAGRHPKLLGSEVRKGWPEVADFNDNVMTEVLAGGSLSYKDQQLVLHRRGAPELVWADLDYSPVLGEDGEPAGVIAIVIETTERVLAERRAGEEQEKQRRLLQQMPGFVAVMTGPEHVFEFVNEAYQAVSGRRDLIGRTIKEAFPELEAQGFYALLNQVYATGERYVAHGLPIKLEGDKEPRFIDLLYEPTRDERGAIAGIFVGGYDATDAYRTAAALSESEARLRLVIEGAKDHAIFTASPAGVITSWSAGAEAIFGWTAEESIGQSTALIFTPEDRADGAPERELTLAAEVGFANDERWHLRKDGGRVFMSGSVHPLKPDGDGLIQGFIKIARDETRRQELDRALKALNETLEQRVEQRTQELKDSKDFTRLALAAVGGVGVWTYDVATDRFVCDENIATLYDIDPKAGAAGVSREAFLKNLHPDDADALSATMANGLVNPGDLELEYRIRHADGSIHWVLSRGHTYFDENGQAIRRTGVGLDVTKQRQLEEQFRQAQKMEAVGQLTGGLAHDFNNLLTGISGSLEMLQTRIAQGRFGAVESYVAAAQGAARRAAALTHRLLAFSRRQTLDPKPTDVNRLVADMTDLVRRTVGPGIEIEVVGAVGLWSTLVDPNQLENALLNLCINARDAMPDGGRITIETANRWLDEHTAADRDLAPGQYVSLCVTDTGTGMTPDVAARVFDPFFTTKPMGEGTGLGLSMIYGFARQSGGQVRVYSEVGHGTTMCIYLPRNHGVSDGNIPQASVPEKPARGAGEVVLVIDDEPTVRMLITEVLDEFGYAGIEAGDGPTGLKVLQSTAKIDLLITDVGLPGGMNGRQIADAARLLRPGLKVLFITGYAENAALGNGHLQPGMEVLTKPFAMGVLAQRIRRIVEG